MRRLSLALFASLFATLISTTVFAQVGVTFFPGPGSPASSGGGYSGPGDVFSFKAWYGLRAYNAASRGNKIANVCDITGGTVNGSCVDLVSNAATGLLVSQSGIGTHSLTCPGANCGVKILYDQTQGANCGGSCDLSQSTVADMPVLLASQNGSLPAMQISASNTDMASAGSLSQTQAYSMTLVADRTAGASLGFLLVSSGNQGIGFDGAGNAVIFAGSAADFTGAANGSFHAIQGMFNGASSIGNADGTSSTGLSPGAASFGGVVHIANTFNQASLLEEMGIAAGDQSANFTSLCHNQRLFWSTGGSC